MTKTKTAMLVVGLAIAVPAAALVAQDPNAVEVVLGAVGLASPKAKSQDPPKQGGPATEARPAVSVAVGRAVRKDMPVRLDAIGTVQAIATVTIRSRVDSQIV